MSEGRKPAARIIAVGDIKDSGAVVLKIGADPIFTRLEYTS